MVCVDGYTEPFEGDVPAVLAGQLTPSASDVSASGHDGPIPPLQQFLGSVAGPKPTPLISTPLARKKKVVPPVCSPRRSGRLAVKKKAKQLKDGAEAIQEVIARVCGILAPEESFDDASRAAYQQMFLRAPLAVAAIQAMDALVKQVKKLKKKGQVTTQTTPVRTSAANV